MGEAVPRLPGETPITGKALVKLGFAYIGERSSRIRWLQSLGLVRSQTPTNRLAFLKVLL